MTEPETSGPSTAEPNIVRWATFEDTKKAFDAHVAAVGKVAHESNYLHEKLGVLFVAVTGMERNLALSIWYSVTSDRAQREMLKASVFATSSQRSEKLPKARDISSGCLTAPKKWQTPATMLSTRHVRCTSGGAFRRWGFRISMETHAPRTL
jgi:hypothetical protein